MMKACSLLRFQQRKKGSDFGDFFQETAKKLSTTQPWFKLDPLSLVVEHHANDWWAGFIESM
jgi:hypothetical protein